MNKLRSHPHKGLQSVISIQGQVCFSIGSSQCTHSIQHQHPTWMPGQHLRKSERDIAAAGIHLADKKDGTQFHMDVNCTAIKCAQITSFAAKGFGRGELVFSDVQIVDKILLIFNPYQEDMHRMCPGVKSPLNLKGEAGQQREDLLSTSHVHAHCIEHYM